MPVDVYKPGQVTAALFSKKKSVSASPSLANLFSATKIPNVDAIPQDIGIENNTSNSFAKKRKPKKKNKKKVEEVDSQAATTTPPLKRKISPPERGQNESVESPTQKKRKSDKIKQAKTETEESVEPQDGFPFVHESLLKANNNEKKNKQNNVNSKQKKKISNSEKRKKEDAEAEKIEERPRRNRQRDKTADKRTVFVGNCPLSTDEKVLKRLFKEYGDVESTRFRCAPPADANARRRAIAITKNFNKKGYCHVGYVVFKEESAAQRALEKNGFVLDGHHLRVDIAAGDGSEKYSSKKSVFIGNLPFDVNEDEIRTHFEDCGDVVNVRIVRDRQTSIGKGICYVQFNARECVSLALKLNKSRFQGRELRVMACSEKVKAKQDKIKNEKGKNKMSTKTKDKKDKPKEKGIHFNPTNKKVVGLKVPSRKEKQLKKSKKKENAKKKDKITQILGSAPEMPEKFRPPKVKKTKGKNKGGKGKAKGSGGQGKKGQGGAKHIVFD